MQYFSCCHWHSLKINTELLIDATMVAISTSFHLKYFSDLPLLQSSPISLLASVAETPYSGSFPIGPNQSLEKLELTASLLDFGIQNDIVKSPPCVLGEWTLNWC